MRLARLATVTGYGVSQVLVSCDGNRIDEELLAVIEGLWNEEQEAGPRIESG